MRLALILSGPLLLVGFAMVSEVTRLFSLCFLAGYYISFTLSSEVKTKARFSFLGLIQKIQNKLLEKEGHAGKQTLVRLGFIALFLALLFIGLKPSFPLVWIFYGSLAFELVFWGTHLGKKVSRS